MLSVIIPVYNERYTIREILRRVCAVNMPKQILIVDDCSTDGTRDILKKLERDIAEGRRAYPHNEIEFIYQTHNQGKGAAIRAAIPKAKHSISLIQDADLEYDPAEYPKLLEPILHGNADVVYGSRFAGSSRRVLFYWHSVANQFLTFLSNIFSNLNLTDMETCYKAIRTDILQSIPIRSNRFGFEPEITAKVAKLGCKIYEVPISYNGRTYAQGKKIGLKDAFQALWVILKYWFVDDLYGDDTAGLRTLRIMEGAGKYNEWLFQQCAPFLGQRVLEMGSGLGNITHFLLDREEVLATDISRGHLRVLEREMGSFENVTVHYLDFTDVPEARRLATERKIDSILSMNVLEHILDDRAALANAFRILVPGGRLVLLVPAHGWLYSPMDKHLQHHRRYDPAALRGLLREAGFKVSHERKLNVLGAMGWFVNGRILGRRLIPSRQLRLFDIVVKLLDFEKKLKPNFGLSVLFVAEKPVTAPRAGEPVSTAGRSDLLPAR